MIKRMCGCSVILIVVFGLLFPVGALATNTWIGAGTTVNASEAANWSGGVPTGADDILLDGTTTNKNLVWDAPSNSLPTTVASWMQNASYTGIVTLKTTYPNYSTTFTNLTINSNLTVNGGTWQHVGNSTTNAYRLALTVGNNFTLGTGGTFSAYALGYAAKSGSGAGRGDSSGGSYGGRAGYNNTPPMPYTYGSVLNPTDLGSGSFGHTTAGNPGGGAIWINVGVAALIDGQMTVNGMTPPGGRNADGGGAGGSIHLQAGTLGGKGMISANGGQDTWHGSGGGGRVALILTQAGTDYSSFSGTVSALGVNVLDAPYAGSGAGTIYRQAGSDAAGFGTVSVSNAWSVTGLCYLPPSIGGALENLTGTAWRVEYKGALGITTNNDVIRSMTLVGNASTLDLGTNVLVVTSNLTVNGTNFATGGYSAAQINAKAGTAQVGNGYVSVGGVPIVETRPPLVGTGAADLKGYLMATGLAATTVYVYWGDTNGGTNKVAWLTNSVLAAPQSIGALTVSITSALNKVYYWYCASNAIGEHWATNGALASLAQVRVRAPDGVACKQPYDPGQFEIYRPGTDTVETVNYTLSGPLSNGWDYTALATNVTLGLGMSNALINILPIGRWNPTDQALTLTLVPGSYSIGAESNATVTFTGIPPPVGTNTWLGGTPTNASSWSQGHVPTNTDNILLDGWAALADMTWFSSMTHTVASWTQTTNYANTVTLMTTFPGYSTVFTNFAVAGDMTLNGGIWRHAANSTLEAYRLALTVGGNLTLGSNAACNLSGLGFYVNNGPGTGTGLNGRGASYGGKGGFNAATPGPTCGSVFAPADLGTGGGELPIAITNYGGGAGWINVGGTASVNGAIAANGLGSCNTGGGGSGGSLYLRAGNLSGSGVVCANGGNDTWHGSGGGGRVAVVLTQAGADFTGFTGAILALGNGTNGYVVGASQGAAAGTVYRQSGSDAMGYGTVTVSNVQWAAGTTASQGNRTHLPPQILFPDILKRTTWVVQNHGLLQLTTNTQVGALTLNAASGFDLGGSTVTVSRLTITNHLYSAGTYTTNTLGTAMVTGNGAIIVQGGGTFILIN